MGRLFSGKAQRLEIDLSAISHNLKQVRRAAPHGVRIAGAVKADAYGHGLVPVSQRLAADGIDYLAIQEVAEGRILRKEGIAAPLMLLVDPGPGPAKEVAGLDMLPVVFRLDTVQALSAAALSQGKTIDCQLKVDTGMGRLACCRTR
jgi:alanine racemase